MQNYQKNVMGGDVDLEALVKGIIETCTQVDTGEPSDIAPIDFC
jgi:hypothetical protein